MTLLPQNPVADRPDRGGTLAVSRRTTLLGLASAFALGRARLAVAALPRNSA